MNLQDAEKKLFHPTIVQRRVRFRMYQWIGIPLLAMFPLLALLGYFGEEEVSLSQTKNKIELTLDYPSKLRYGQKQALKLTIQNHSDKVLKEVIASFDEAYIDQFSDLKFTPESHTATSVVVRALAPGETRSIYASLKADEYGRHLGSLNVSADDMKFEPIEMSTFVFP